MDKPIIENPPGYGETIGGVVLSDPPDSVIEAACEAYGETPDAWSITKRFYPALAAEERKRMTAAIRAAVAASA